jgi:TolB protein
MARHHSRAGLRWIGGARALAPVLALLACGGDDARPGPRADRAVEIRIDLAGSLQNPCFSPDGSRLVVTRFLGGYNEGESRVELVTVDGMPVATLSGTGAQAVNMPGSCWSAARNAVAFTSDAEEDGDQIWEATPDPAAPRPVRLSALAGAVAFEPTYSPDGTRIAFERHGPTGEDAGAICIYTIRDGAVECVTDGSTDERQPNWSPAGDRIVFQGRSPRGDVDIFTIDLATRERRDVTDSPADDTDASFSPDGARIVYSSDEGGIDVANLFVIPTAGGEPTRVTRADGWYDGAPAFAPDGRSIAFESRDGDADGSAGTVIRRIDLM